MTLTCSVILIATLNFLFSSLARIPLVSTTMAETVTKCKGDNFVLNKPAAKVTAPDVNVFRNGEFVANTSVQARGDLQNRLVVHTDGSVELTNLTSTDFGEYVMRVKLSSDETKDRTVRLIVRELPETADGRLSVTSVSSNTSVRLRCGPFTSLGYPSVSVIWKDSVNQLLASTRFSKQFFTLDLPLKMASSGNYCCQIDCRDPSHCCFGDQSPLRQCAMFELQTGEKNATQDSKCQEGMPLVNVSGLVQRVFEIYHVARGLERNSAGLACIKKSSGAVVNMSVAEPLEDRGVPGPKGERGDDGLPGLPGVIGPAGATGLDGLPGLPGLPGQKGNRGEPGLPGVSGDPGSTGPVGVSGPEGPAGAQGQKGEQGTSGKPGLPGLRGENCVPGLPGQDGLPGHPGRDLPGLWSSTEHLVVRHSQSIDVPMCPLGLKKLWEGYSLLVIQGWTGSCLTQFSTTPFFSCDMSDDCYFPNPDASSYWLLAGDSIPKTPDMGRDVTQHISRCVSCEAPAKIITLHSQTSQIPPCPQGWSAMWSGYSFAAALSSPTSCLEDFHPSPFIQCKAGACQRLANRTSLWMSTVANTMQLVTPTPERLSADNSKARVSRCQVCVKGLPQGT